ncbi:MAG: NUDIX domain-containing protein [Clostridia bacterium]|nr:NUDIX domain-containing protein [Clostridia bacterium]
MKKIGIYGENRVTPYEKTRVGCRGVLVEDGKLLVSVASSAGGVMMLPGGGLEDGETLEECCRRELEEETGVVVEPLMCFLELDEYYGEYKFVDYYFVCRRVGEGERRLTRFEERVGLEAVMMSVDEFMTETGAFSKYIGSDEERAGIYLREFVAMREYLEAAGEGEKK